jgi:2-polyprenyl-3-methyl-5-hydroxy-6-metoxy-1,4-benzoquinol methylase
MAQRGMDSTNHGGPKADPTPVAGPVTREWCLGEERTVPARCPICSDAADKRQLLTVSSSLSGARAVVRCANCEAVFIPELPAWPYDAFPTEFVRLYIEQGASIDLMVQPLLMLPRSSVRRYLEVGCGFGFGVDFAAQALGWTAIGLEPSQLGVAGRAALGIDLRAEYLDENTAFSELHDVVFSSEVLEHVPEPRPFLRAAVRALAPHGVLMLTTPNAARLTPAASEYSQLSILSYPFHAILYTRHTLERVLTEVGLPFVHVIERDDTLIAMASTREFTPLEARLDRADFQAYLSHRLARLEPGTPVATGYAYRLFKECVNRADYAGAELALEQLRREVTLRFGAERGRLRPDLGRPDATLDDYARAHPLNLCGCYYFQGMLALNHH